MYYLPDQNRIFININKNASTSLTRALHQAGIKRIGIGRKRFFLDPYKDMERIAMWRDPFRRAESGYRMIRERRPHDLGGLNFHDWILKVCREGSRDPHVYSQYKHCVYNGVWLPTKILRWDFIAFQEIFGTGPIPQLNQAFPYDLAWTERAAREYRLAFKEDFEVWYGCQELTL